MPSSGGSSQPRIEPASPAVWTASCSAGRCSIAAAGDPTPCLTWSSFPDRALVGSARRELHPFFGHTPCFQSHPFPSPLLPTPGKIEGAEKPASTVRRWVASRTGTQPRCVRLQPLCAQAGCTHGGHLGPLCLLLAFILPSSGTEDLQNLLCRACEQGQQGGSVGALRRCREDKRSPGKMGVTGLDTDIYIQVCLSACNCFSFFFLQS